MPAICKAGIFVTACFDASQVVPQKILTHTSATNALLLVLHIAVYLNNIFG
jgi:hypothetical protein